jgi:VanZ family protein
MAFLDEVCRLVSDILKGMLPLLALSAVLILYGTLFPFSIVDSAHASDIVPRLLASFTHIPGRGDALSNIVLFLPFGFFGMQAVLPRFPRIARLVCVCILGGALSLFIECTQTFIAGRNTSVFDLLLNTFGTLAGACAGWVDWNRRLGSRLSQEFSNDRPLSLFPPLMLGAWLALRLYPYVPTLDYQHVKDAIKPLLTGSVEFADVLRYFVLCLVVGRLLQAFLTPTRALLGMLLLVLGVIAAKPFLMTRELNLAEIIGTAAAIVVWVAFLARQPHRSAILAALLALAILVQGLTPFSFTVGQPFSFVPFKGFEGGSMATNLQAFLEKVFLYGSLIWLLAGPTVRIAVATVMTAVLLTVIELIQTTLPVRVPEITDPLLAIILGCVLFSLERSSRASGRIGADAKPASRNECRDR